MAVIMVIYVMTAGTRPHRMIVPCSHVKTVGYKDISFVASVTRNWQNYFSYIYELGVSESPKYSKLRTE